MIIGSGRTSHFTLCPSSLLRRALWIRNQGNRRPAIEIFLKRRKRTLLPFGLSSASASSLAHLYLSALGVHVPEIYLSWKEAQSLTVGTLADVKRFTLRKRAKSTGPGNPSSFDNPTACLFKRSWRLGRPHHIFCLARIQRALWGPVAWLLLATTRLAPCRPPAQQVNSIQPCPGKQSNQWQTSASLPASTPFFTRKK